MDSLFTVEAGDGLGPWAPPVVEAPSMRRVYAVASRAADAPLNIVILGEPGAGKTTLARWIHQKSRRARGPLVTMSCGHVDHELEEAMFGSEPTPERDAYPGALESANGGTVILRDVDALNAPDQSRLLRALETREVARLGSTSRRRIDVRYVSTSAVDLEAAAATSAFRKDLLFRLSAFTLLVPPLRERPGEIEPLAQRFLAEARQGADGPGLSAAVLESFRSFAWPRNLAQLREVVATAYARCTGPEITPEHVDVDALRDEAVPVGGGLRRSGRAHEPGPRARRS